jgi:hexokinase
MHQIFKVILKDLIEEKLINPEVLNMMNLDTIDSEQIDHLMRSTDFNSEDKEALYFIWREINKRGGNLCGMVMAVMMVNVHKNLGKDLTRIIITETGSVFKKNIRFRESLFDSLDRELGRLGYGEKIQYKFVNLSDRAALGAVVFDTYFNLPTA